MPGRNMAAPIQRGCSGLAENGRVVGELTIARYRLARRRFGMSAALACSIRRPGIISTGATSGRSRSAFRGTSRSTLPVQMIWPVAKRGRPRQRHVPDVLSIPAEDMLTHAKWHTISWRTGTKGKLKAGFAAVRVRVATDHRSGSWTRGNSISGIGVGACFLPVGLDALTRLRVP